MPCARLRPRRSPTGCRRRPASATQGVVAALALRRGRSDGSAAGTARRSPWPATYGRRADRHREACRAAPARPQRAREQLVPAAEARPLARSTRQRQLDADRLRQRAVGIACGDGRVDVRVERVSAAGVAGTRRRFAARRRPARELRARSAPPAPARAGLRLRSARRRPARPATHVVALDAALEVVAPGQEAIDPGRDRVAYMAAVAATVKSRASDRCRARAASRLRATSRRSSRRQQQHAREPVVAVGEAMRFDRDRLADDALDREAAAVDDAAAPHR